MFTLQERKIRLEYVPNNYEEIGIYSKSILPLKR